MVSKKSGHLYEKRLILKVIKVSRALEMAQRVLVRDGVSGPLWAARTPLAAGGNGGGILFCASLELEQHSRQVSWCPTAAQTAAKHGRPVHYMRVLPPLRCFRRQSGRAVPFKRHPRYHARACIAESWQCWPHERRLGSATAPGSHGCSHPCSHVPPLRRTPPHYAPCLAALRQASSACPSPAASKCLIFVRPPCPVPAGDGA